MDPRALQRPLMALYYTPPKVAIFLLQKTPWRLLVENNRDVRYLCRTLGLGLIGWPKESLNRRLLPLQNNNNQMLGLDPHQQHWAKIKSVLCLLAPGPILLFFLNMCEYLYNNFDQITNIAYNIILYCAVK